MRRFGSENRSARSFDGRSLETAIGVAMCGIGGSDRTSPDRLRCRVARQLGTATEAELVMVLVFLATLLARDHLVAS
jgi:hypothetical protein